MGIVSALVLYAVIWFLVLFVVLPIGLQTQGDRNEIVPGTQAGAPARLDMWRKARIVTLVSLVIWAIIATVIWAEIITVRDIDWFNRMRPPSDR